MTTKFKSNRHYRIEFTGNWTTYAWGNQVKKTLTKHQALTKQGVQIHDVTECDEMTRIDSFKNLVYTA